MKMNRCIFLIAWMDGSPGADGLSTGVHRSEDLMRLFAERSTMVSAYFYWAPEGHEWEIGAAHAFRDNYTAEDTFSSVLIEADVQMPTVQKG